jgi:hypothetical protein
MADRSIEPERSAREKEANDCKQDLSIGVEVCPQRLVKSSPSPLATFAPAVQPNQRERLASESGILSCLR